MDNRSDDEKVQNDKYIYFITRKLVIQYFTVKYSCLKHSEISDCDNQSYSVGTIYLL